jgi:hypothetical protein
MTSAQVRRRIRGLLLTEQRKVVCALVGHSLIVESCFGYVHCARCGAQIADKLGGAGFSGAEKCVQIGHNCEMCHKNYKALGWQHKFLTPNPFAKRKERGHGE